MHGQRGQTATEYLGMLLVVAAIVLALSQTAVGKSIGTSLSCQIAKIAQQSSCAASKPTPAKPSDPGGPTQGPPLQNAPANFPVLPFPGSVSVTCTASATKDAQDCQGNDESPVDAGVRASGSVSRSKDQLDGDGCPTTSLSTSASLEAYGSATVDGKVAGAGVEVYAGTATDYDVTTTPSRADDYAKGQKLPNPLDPRTIHPGEGLELSDRYYHGTNADASYRALQASLGYEAGRKVSSGVQRVDPKTVRVYVGDSRYVKNALSLGPGGDVAKLYLGNETELSAGKLKAVDIDVSTPQGWAAYQRFVASGTLPATGTAGTSNPTRSDTVDITSASKIGAEINGVDLSVDFGDGEGHRSETHNPDGSVTSTIDARDNDAGVQIVGTRDAQGNPVGDTTYALNLDGVDPALVKNYQQANGLPQVDAHGHLRLQFSGDDLTKLHDQAVKQQRQQQKNGLTIADPVVTALARASNPTAVLLALQQGGRFGTDGLLNKLVRFGFNTDLANHDNKPSRVLPLPADARVPGKQVTPDCA